MGIYKLRGPLEPHDVVNIRRKELEDIRKEVRDSYIALFSPRQTGKTTLLRQLQEELHGKGYGVVYISLEGLEELDEPDFYGYLCQKIESGLKGILNTGDINTATNTTDFTENYLKAISKGTPLQTRNVVLMLDEVGGVPEAIHSKFFRGIRRIYTESKVSIGEGRIYRKLRFVFAGAFDLIKIYSGLTSPPANICKFISLDDFSSKQVESLVDKLVNLSDESKQTLAEAIYDCAAGHPYLTQKLCSLVEESSEYKNGDLNEPEEFIQNLAQKAIVHAYPRDQNLRYLFSYLRDNERYPDAPQYVEELRKILDRKRRKGTELLEELSVIGWVKQEADGIHYVIRNKIYEEALNNAFNQGVFQ